MTDCRKHELAFRYSNTDLGTVKWILSSYSLIKDNTTELHGRLGQTFFFRWNKTETVGLRNTCVVLLAGVKGEPHCQTESSNWVNQPFCSVYRPTLRVANQWADGYPDHPSDFRGQVFKIIRNRLQLLSLQFPTYLLGSWSTDLSGINTAHLYVIVREANLTASNREAGIEDIRPFCGLLLQISNHWPSRHDRVFDFRWSKMISSLSHGVHKPSTHIEIEFHYDGVPKVLQWG